VVLPELSEQASVNAAIQAYESATVRPGWVEMAGGLLLVRLSTAMTGSWVLAKGRCSTDSDGYRKMLEAGRQHAVRIWAVEGYLSRGQG
jgi:hypothetical protein